MLINLESITLGILGGLGPMSSVYFYEMLTAHTRAIKDQQHLNIIISSRANTPDRTDYILGRSQESPLPAMIEEAQRLELAGAGIIAIPCNTAHCFYEGICDSVNIPILNIIRMTVEFCRSLGLRKVGLLATEGTVDSRAYENALKEANINCIIPKKEDQNTVSNIIYEQVKKGLAPDIDAFLEVVDNLRKDGCERMILGCTELSLLKRNHLPGNDFIDSLEVLALSAIRLCGKEPKNFDAELMAFSVPCNNTFDHRIAKGSKPCC